MKRRTGRPLVALWFAVLLAACQGFSGFPSRSSVPLAEINGEAIRIEEFNARFARHWAHRDVEEPAPLEIKLHYLNNEIEEALVLQEARRMGLAVSAEELEAAVREAKAGYSERDFAQLLVNEYLDLDEWRESLGRRRLMAKATALAVDDRIEITSAEIAAYYQAHRAEMARPEQVHVRQAVFDSWDKAETFSRRLQAGESFAALAQALSQGPKAESGGDLGWLSRGQILRSLEGAIAALAPGQVSAPVKSEYGYHILELLGRRPAQLPSLEESTDLIRNRLRDQRRELYYRRWIEQLWSHAQIQVNYELL